MSSKTVVKIDKTDTDALNKINKALKNNKIISNDTQNTTTDTSEALNKDLVGSLDIYLLKDDVKITEFNGVYTVKILLDTSLREKSNLSVVYVNDDGDIEIFNTSLEDAKFLVFNTTHFSEFYILADKDNKDVNLLALIIILLIIDILLIGVISYLIINYKLNKNKAYSLVFPLILAILPKHAVVYIIVLSILMLSLIAGLIVVFREIKK